MLPKGWERKALEKLSEIKTGVAKGKKGLKDPIEVPYLRVANVQDGHIDLSEVKTIQIERHQLERYSLQRGDVLMTEGGDFDKLGRGDVWQGQIEPCLNQNHVFAVRVDKNLLIPYFLAALSGSHYGKTYFLSCAKRSTNLASINSTQLKEFPVIIPPFPEQQKIVKILSTWDNAITTTEKLIANSKQQKKALMQQLLTGKKRLVNPETGKAFDGEWEKAKLGDLAEYSKGYTYKSHEYSERPTEFGFLTLKSILRGGGYSKKGIKYIHNEVNEKFSVTEEDVVFAVTDLTRNADVVGAPILIPKLPYEKTFISMDLLKLELSPSVDKRFFFYLLKLRDNRNFMRARASGSTVLHLDIKGSKKMPLQLPCLEEQHKIASALTAADKEIELLEAKLAHFKQEKKALMQQLLTGKRRVKIAT